MKGYNKLCFSSSEVGTVGNQVNVTTQFKCPVCGGHAELTKYMDVPADKDLDVNSEVTCVFSCCAVVNRLYLAVYQPLGTDKLQVQFSVEPIAADWWQRRETV